MSGISTSRSPESQDGTVSQAEQHRQLIEDLTRLCQPWITGWKNEPSASSWQDSTVQLLRWSENVHAKLGLLLDNIQESLLVADFQDTWPNRKIQKTEIARLEGKKNAYEGIKKSSSELGQTVSVMYRPSYRESDLQVPAAISLVCKDLENDFYGPPLEAFVESAKSLATRLWMTLFVQDCPRKVPGLPDGTQRSAHSSGLDTE